MTPFQRGLYRHYINSQRHFEKKHGLIERMARLVRDTEDPTKMTEQVVEIDRTWPLNLAAIVRILRMHTLYNRGEGRTQALRVIAEIDDQGEKGVMAVTIDRLYGLFEFRFMYKSWFGIEICGNARRIADMIRPGGQPNVLALYRLSELLDGIHASFIMDALEHPEGAGFPKFTKRGSRDLIVCMESADTVIRSGVPEGLKDGHWYAMNCKPFSQEPSDTLRIFIGQAFTLKRSVDDWQFRQGGISVVAENEGYGRIVPMHDPRPYQPWLKAFKGKLFPWYASRLEAIQAYVVRPFNGTSRLMADCLKRIA
jgi:hypothetical protein